MRKVWLFLAALAALAGPALAQPATTVSRDLFAGLEYDVDSTSLTYCVTTGPNTGNQLIWSTGGGSAATLVPTVAASAPFTGMAVGDVLRIPQGTSTYAYRVVTVFTSVNAITVDSVITIPAGTTFTWYRNSCGTGITNGWFSIPAAASRVAMSVFFEQGDIATLSARFECQPTGEMAQPVIIYPGETSDCGLGGTLSTDRCDFAQAVAGTATGSLTVIDEDPIFTKCRVGLAYKTSDTLDTTVNLEKVTVTVSIR